MEILKNTVGTNLSKTITAIALVQLLASGLTYSAAHAATIANDETPATPYRLTGFETAHKPQAQEFASSHKIMSLSNEKPELNPALSAIIGKDIMESIRLARELSEGYDGGAQATPAPVQSAAIVETEDEDELGNSGASSNDRRTVVSRDGTPAVAADAKPPSRTQIKMGPNGVEYEYEYVYYYDDDDFTGAGAGEKSDEIGSRRPAQVDDRQSNRYTTIDRGSPAVAPTQATVVPLANDVDTVDVRGDERLPANTRFPPRATEDPTVVAASASGGRRISVKRPSVELVDSQSFNTDDKGAKGAAAAAAANAAADASTVSLRFEGIDQGGLPEIMATVAEISEADTTPPPEKSAIDLYAIAANENLSAESEQTTGETTTDGSVSGTTDFTTALNSFPTTTFAPTTTTTTTTTTTPAPTTTPATTTSTEGKVVRGRGGTVAAAGSRNRFHIRPAASTEVSSTAAPVEETKPKSRFGRPSFGGRATSQRGSGSPSSTTTQSPPSGSGSDDTPKFGGSKSKPRNRFNSRTSVAPTTAAPSEDGADSDSSSGTRRSSVAPRARPTFQLRTRGRAGVPTSSTPATESESGADGEAAPVSAPARQFATKATPVSVATTPAPARASRFNIGRSPLAGGPNRNLLAPRGRLGPLGKANEGIPAVPSAAEVNDEINGSAEDPEAAGAGASVSETAPAAQAERESTATGGEEGDEPAVPTISGINRLKSRPRIQVQPRVDTRAKQQVMINRSANPLLARRKLGGIAAPAPVTPNPEDDAPLSDGADDDAAPTAGDSADETLEVAASPIPETTTEQLRGLGLLGNRRRIQMRRPGNLN